MNKYFYHKIMDFAQEFNKEYAATLPPPDGSGLPENEQLIVTKIATLFNEIDEICPGKGYAFLIAPLATRFFRKRYTHEL